MSVGKPYSQEEVLAAVARVLRFAREQLEARGTDDPYRAVSLADLDATHRSLARLERGLDEGPEQLAGLLAWWTFERANRPDPTRSLRVALAAAEGRAGDAELASDLREFVHRYVTGEMSDDEFVRNLKKPRRRKASPTPRRAPPAGAVVVAAAEEHLRMMLRAARAEDALEVRAFWPVFRGFVGVSVTAAPGEVQSDLLLFQWDSYRAPERFGVEFVRQFALGDEDGDQDHMEQLTCTFTFELTDELQSLRSGHLWETGKRQAWLDDVEAHGVFRATAARRATVVTVRQEEI